MTTQELLAEQIERMGESLAHFIETTSPEQRTWKPQVTGSAPTRSVLEQASECIAVNRNFAALLRGEQVEVPTGGAVGKELLDLEEARTELIESSRELAAAVRALDEEALDRRFAHWRGPVPGKSLVMGAFRNMAYHAGQINLIQILGGDAAFHTPPTWY